MESKRVFFVAQMMCFFVGTELLHGGFSSGISYMIPGECQFFQVICLVSTLKKRISMLRILPDFGVTFKMEHRHVTPATYQSFLLVKK